jgi:small subunit ribosomal protein S2
MTQATLENINVHYGYSKSRRHPSMQTYIAHTKNNIDIFDVEKIQQTIDAATVAIQDLAKKGKTVLFVGTKPEIKDIVRRGAEKAAMPYVIQRWVGGTLTNFSEIGKRVNKLIANTTGRDEEKYSKYTKKEKLLMERETKKLDLLFGGLVDMKKKPDALFVIDVRAEHIAIQEAEKEGIPVFGIANSDCNIEDIAFPIVGNDTSRDSVLHLVNVIATAYSEAYASPNTDKPSVK